MAKKPKKQSAVKCEKCNLEFPESELSEEHKNKAFVFDDKILCKECLIMMGGDPGSATNYWDFHHDPNKAKPHDW